MPELHTELCPDLVECLACPVCAAPLRVSDGGGSLLCARDPATGRAHCFDGAASGYLPLSPRHTGGGDAKEAVTPRRRFVPARRSSRAATMPLPLKRWCGRLPHIPPQAAAFWMRAVARATIPIRSLPQDIA